MLDKKYVLKVPLNKDERIIFSKAFRKSGLRSMSEFVRHLVNQYLSETRK